MDGSLSSSGILLSSGSRLRGAGTVTAPVTLFFDNVVESAGTLGSLALSNSGYQRNTVNPAGPSGTAVLSTAGLSIPGNNTLSMELNGADPGNGYDQVSVTGTVNIDGTSLQLSLGYLPVIGTVFTLIDNDGTDPVTGTFGGLTQGSLLPVGSETFQISYTGGTGNDVTLTALTGAPVGTETTVGLFSGDLVVIDAISGGKTDNLQVSFDGTEYPIQDTSSPTGRVLCYGSIPGATGNGTSTVTIPAAAFTHGIRTTTMGGNDAIDVHGLGFNAILELAIDGGGGTDAVRFTGAPSGGESISVTGESIEIGQDLTTSGGDLLFEGPVVLTGDVSLATAGGDAIFRSTVDALVANQQSLTINAGTGDVQLNGRVGEFQSGYEQAVLSDGPVAYWRLGENAGPTIDDSSGNNLNGSVVGPVTLGTVGALSGDPDTAASFPDPNAEISIPDHNLLTPAGNTLTLEAWFRPTAPGSVWQPIVAKWDYPTYREYWLGIDPGGRLRFDSLYETLTGPYPTPNVWQHIALVRTGGAVSMFLNGNLVGQSGQGGGALPNTPVPVLIGGDANSSQGNYFRGNIDEVAIYNAPLSQGQLQAHISAASVAAKGPLSTLLVESANRVFVNDNLRAGSVIIGDGTASATLAGTGTVDGSVLVASNSVVNAGTSPGVLHTSSSTFASGSSFDVEIGGSSPGNTATNHDQLQVTGSVTMQSNVSMNLSAFGGFTPSVGDQFVIIDNDGTDPVTGTFDGLPEGATITGFLGSSEDAVITYQGGDGNDVVLILETATPGTDYVNAGGDYGTLACGTITFAPGQTSKTIKLQVVNDGDVESDETVVVTLSSPAGGGLGTPSQATHTI